eukprot:CAMPEP_0197636134 /NCGR_PEP_ID=MMETSP1338-20131121/11743_1 /TAXON_ID=43686 ORGANISM="Pelagodinium beii, Strain RCC1491" /NCGR_SAMPLE_ID=MMETSP1338 /ASSEMBLY_ACC=CAM_ASM_000754 /LENGTH=348 /DNA_ID=CAMNT_0043208323 /DNA_START=75 /DNA_END=1121 /DNA_ORIENTATION=-
MAALRGSGNMLFSFVAAFCFHAAGAQFGGYTPPPPICSNFKCKKGEKRVGKPMTEIVSYGCKDSGMNIMSMGKDFDPSNPFGSMNQGGKNLNKCCIERDICKQTCGSTSKECHDAFQKCQTKICKGDQNCNLQAMISEMGGDPFDTEKDAPFDKDKKYDPNEAKCRGYENAQKAVCQCVPEEEVTSTVEGNLKVFYKKYNPEKLDKAGEIKDLDEVWKKWKGKEPSLFMALFTKYKDKSVTIKEKPKPPPYKPPPKEEEDSEVEEPAQPTAEESEEDDGVDNFGKSLKELLEQKEKAKKDEDFDLAEEIKEKVDKLKAEELEKLKAKKAQALEEENFLEAKKPEGPHS